MPVTYGLHIIGPAVGALGIHNKHTRTDTHADGYLSPHDIKQNKQ